MPPDESRSGDPDPAKALGGPDCQPVPVFCGEPVNVATGNLYEEITDYETAGSNALQFVRYYNGLSAAGTSSGMLGRNWRSTYDRYLRIRPPTTVIAERADGQELTFVQLGAWTAGTDVDVALAPEGNQWVLTDSDDTLERYAPVKDGSTAVLTSVRARNGYTQSLQYDSNNRLVSVTDSFGRSLQFTYDQGLVKTVTTPDGLLLTYDYSSSRDSGALDRLSSVTYSTTPQTRQFYLYENPAFPFALTGIVDENGDTYTRWSYDSSGRVISSEHAGGADRTLFGYSSDGSRSVTNALGAKSLYQFMLLQGTPKVTKIIRLETQSTASATREFAYDSRGYLAAQTDWNGNLTTYTNDAHGQPISVTEAAGTAQARTTTLKYHEEFHLPVRIEEPGLATDFTYDADGNLLTRTLIDMTENTVPYATTGTKRTWTYTWANGLLTGIRGPRTDVTQQTTFGYDGSGTLTQTTNALGHQIRVTQHTPGGLPERIVDANGVTQEMAYDARLRLVSVTVDAASDRFQTRYEYDAAGNLVKATLPDGSAVTGAYDLAHRLTGLRDLFGQTVTYTLDALGDRTETQIRDSSGSVRYSHSTSFDALGRATKETGGAGQASAFSYDTNDNPTLLTDGLQRMTTQVFDPLNRLFQTIDPAGGTTSTTFDAHDRPLTVTDANGGTTTYTYDGFGELIQVKSPDSGTTVYRYDAAGNVTQKIDARGVATHYSYDALDRLVARTYPGDAAENVLLTYDEPGHGFAVGKLTSVTDAVGTLTRSYDERGNLLREKRVQGAVVLTTSYSYDALNRVASLGYPSGVTVSYGRDEMGRVISVDLQPASGTAAMPVLSKITYEPFGPLRGFTFGNGIVGTRTFDLDYRLTNLIDAGVLDLQYRYDSVNNVLGIADGIDSARSQTFEYDVLDRLIGASGIYGNLNYTYDLVGNRLTERSDEGTTSYGYAPQSNRLMTITSGASLQRLAYTADGSISAFSGSIGGGRSRRRGDSGLTAIEYNQAGRLYHVLKEGQDALQYWYDAFGHRLAKTGIANATLYQYDQAGHLLEGTDGLAPRITDNIYLGDAPIATYYPATDALTFLHIDRLGTPQKATNSSRVQVWSADYEPFGTVNLDTSKIDEIRQNLRFPGQEFELETGWYHNGFRDYVPLVGRYMQTDPIGLTAGLNSYTYVSGRPTGATDPNGLQEGTPLFTRDVSGAAAVDLFNAYENGTPAEQEAAFKRLEVGSQELELTTAAVNAAAKVGVPPPTGIAGSIQFLWQNLVQAVCSQPQR